MNDLFGGSQNVFEGIKVDLGDAMLLLQQISSVNYEQDECSVYCSSTQYMGMCVHAYNCRALPQKAACMSQQVFNHSRAAATIKDWPRTGGFFPVDAVDTSTGEDVISHM